MQTRALTLVIAGCLALGACSTNLQQLQAPPPATGGTDFTRALAQQYRTFAGDAWSSRVDFSTSERFAAKAMRVNAGEALPPEDERAQATVREAVSTIRAVGSVSVLVQGYSDTVGAPDANRVLSERRAGEVRRALLAAGVQADIKTHGFGETELAIATPDNTTEQRNRRVVIIVR